MIRNPGTVRPCVFALAIALATAFLYTAGYAKEHPGPPQLNVAPLSTAEASRPSDAQDHQTITALNLDVPDKTEGNCPANLLGGPLLSNEQAARLVKPAPKSTPETGPDAAANAVANSYYYRISKTDPAGYQEQLQSFWATAHKWGGVTRRIDGACLLGPHPTTAEVLQWAAHKWGISPLLLYAAATGEGDWNQTNIGDQGGSSGVFQVSDRPANRPGGEDHAFPGFKGAGANLARENTCFNADMYAGHLYAVYHGISTQPTPAWNIDAAVQGWFQYDASGAGPYSRRICGFLNSQAWKRKFFNGQSVPY